MREESAAADRKVRELAADQDGVITRAQALDCGLTGIRVAKHVAAGRWQVIHRGVYAIFSGPVPRASFLWAAVLSAGPGAMLSHETAAELWGLSDRPSLQIHVTVPGDRWPARRAGLTVHRSCRAEITRHPSRMPPRTSVEDTIVDLTQAAGRLEDAISWLARAIGARFTTAPRLLACFERRPKLSWRASLYAALGDVRDGSHSLLELRYLRDVERAHGLPRSERQVQRPSGHYDDVRYRQYRVRVELDGQAAHPEHERSRDMRRDNAAVKEGDHVLRYGLADVTTDPCDVAVEVANILRRNGWPRPPRRCGRPNCAISR